MCNTDSKKRLTFERKSCGKIIRIGWSPKVTKEAHHRKVTLKEIHSGKCDRAELQILDTTCVQNEYVAGCEIVDGNNKGGRSGIALS